jgi:putative DNA primase/helicase
MSNQFIDKVEVKSKARGNWLSIISKIAPFLSDATEKVGIHHTCPIHGGLDGFRFYKDAEDTGGGVCNTCGNFPDGLSLLTWATQKSFYDVLKDVAEVVGSGEFSNPAPKRSILPKVKDAKAIETEDKIKRLRLRAAYATSIRSSAPGSSLLHAYLHSRGLKSVPEMLRFHPSMAYRQDDGSTINMPAMLAMVRQSNGTPVTLHRTYLNAQTGSKADVRFPKKVMSHTSDVTHKGASIQLYPATGDTLCVAEGIETSIAVYEATGIPTWATVSAVFMESFVPPENIKRLFVFADKDKSETGLTSAKKLVESSWAKGIQASIQLPPSEIPDSGKGIDWLDEYLLTGTSLFPKFR